MEADLGNKPEVSNLRKRIRDASCLLFFCATNKTEREIWSAAYLRLKTDLIGAESPHSTPPTAMRVVI